MSSFRGKTVFISGASRGIGAAIAKRLGKEGANIILAAKTAEPHAKLPGTIYSVAKEIEDLGGKALPIPTDIRNEEQVENAVKKAVEKFGGIDILINNASAIWLRPTPETDLKRFDLMNQINYRGTYACSYYCLPYLKKSAQQGRNPQILNLSPPISLEKKWFKDHVAYTIAKYNMSLCVFGMSAELEPFGIGVNALWPRTGIATAAIEWIAGKEGIKSCRNVDIMSDAAYYILRRDGKKSTGNFFIDDEVLLSEGMTEKDLEKYAIDPSAPLMPDFFLDSMVPKFSKL